ncbi:MAG: hypothetical protein OHK0013_03610 [Sandaracinaceae bacterium]
MAVADAGLDAFRIRTDTGGEDDAGADGGSDAGRPALRDPERCRVEPSDVFLLGSDADVGAATRIVGVAGRDTEFGVVWREAEEGLPQIRLARVPSTVGDPAVQTVTDGAFTHDEPAIAAVGDGYMIAWVDNSFGDLEVLARSASADGLGAVQRLSERVGRDDAPALVSVGESVVAGWMENRDMDTTRVAVTRRLDASGAPSSPPRAISGTPSRLGRLELAPRMGGAVALWTAPSASGADVTLQRLDATGAPMGTQEVLSTEHNASGDVDVGLTSRDGAVVFGALVAGVRRDVRVRLLDGTGTPGMSEFALNVGAEFGDSASVARLREAAGWSEGCRDGYAVVYRSYPDGGTTPVLRLVLLDAGAAVVRAIDLAPSDVSARGGRVTLRIAGDGQLLVAWTDVRDTSVDIRAARIRCD